MQEKRELRATAASSLRRLERKKVVGKAYIFRNLEFGLENRRIVFGLLEWDHVGKVDPFGSDGERPTNTRRRWRRGRLHAWEEAGKVR